MTTDLSSLARTLAERLLADFAKPSTNSMRYPHQLKIAEAVIREAIEKTLEIAAHTVGTAKSSHGCDDFIIRNDAEDAIRSLRPR